MGTEPSRVELSGRWGRPDAGSRSEPSPSEGATEPDTIDGAGDVSVRLKQPEVVASRQRHDRTHLIVDAGENRYHVTVAVARDHSTGRAIGFRYWIRNEQVTLREQEAIDAALRDIAVLEGIEGINYHRCDTRVTTS